MAEVLEETVIEQNPQPAFTPPVTDDLDISEISVGNVDETIRASVNEALGIGGIDVTSSMGTSTITTPSVPTQGMRDPSEIRRLGGVHFKEADRDKDKGGGDRRHRTRRYEIEICRPPYCKGDTLEFRTMTRYARERKICGEDFA